MEIKFENVDYSYKKINYLEKNVLNNISIEFKKGKINSLLWTSSSNCLISFVFIKFNVVEIASELSFEVIFFIKFSDDIILLLHIHKICV